MQDPRYSGEQGELFGGGFLLEFVTLAKPRPDTGEDYVGWLRDVPSKRVEFAFQIKNAKHFRVLATRVVQWIDDIEHRPVIFLSVDSTQRDAVRYRFLVLFDWLILNPEWPQRILRQKTISFPLKSFCEGAENFHSALTRECDRVKEASRSLWRVQRSRTLPVSLGDVFQNFGRLVSFQVPQSVLDELREVGSLSEEQAWDYLRRCWRGDVNDRGGGHPSSAIEKWIKQLGDTPSKERVMEELTEFRRFVFSLGQYEGGNVFDMPGYTRRELWPWRVFFAKFPQSFVLLRRVFQRPALWRPQQVISGLLLASTMAHIGDLTLSNAAYDLLRRQEADFARPYVTSYEQYQVVANYYAARAEAGGQRELDAFMNFTRRHLNEVDDWDLQLMPDYYETNYFHSAPFSMAKVRNPKPRYLNALCHEEWRLERLE